MDKDEATFGQRVAAAIKDMHGPGAGAEESSVPVFSSSGQSSMVNSYASSVSSGASGPSVAPSPRVTKEHMYWLCRRSLRLWPVPGKQGPEIRESLKIFLKDRLRFSSVFLSEMGEASTKRIATAPGSRIKDEVVVVFSTVEIRDAVRRAAKELAGDNGAGIRLEVPRGLQPSLKALEAVSYNLKQKNNGIKRNIRFDDLAQDLVLDFNTCLLYTSPSPRD